MPDALSVTYHASTAFSTSRPRTSPNLVSPRSLRQAAQERPEVPPLLETTRHAILRFREDSDGVEIALTSPNAGACIRRHHYAPSTIKTQITSCRVCDPLRTVLAGEDVELRTRTYRRESESTARCTYHVWEWHCKHGFVLILFRSKCPDARACLQKLVLPTMANVSDKVDFRLSFIGKYVDSLVMILPPSQI